MCNYDISLFCGGGGGGGVNKGKEVMSGDWTLGIRRGSTPQLKMKEIIVDSFKLRRAQF